MAVLEDIGKLIILWIILYIIIKALQLEYFGELIMLIISLPFGMLLIFLIVEGINKGLRGETVRSDFNYSCLESDDSNFSASESDDLEYFVPEIRTEKFIGGYKTSIITKEGGVVWGHGPTAKESEMDAHKHLEISRIQSCRIHNISSRSKK